MLVEKTIKVWKLSDENKQTIKDNARKIKNYLATLDYDTCIDFFDGYCRSDSEFFNFIGDYLPFVKEESLYITESETLDLVTEIDLIIERIDPYLTRKDFAEDDDIIEFIEEKNDIKDLIQKILVYGDENFINKLLNE
jgi:hypothetical protein